MRFLLMVVLSSSCIDAMPKKEIINHVRTHGRKHTQPRQYHHKVVQTYEEDYSTEENNPAPKKKKSKAKRILKMIFTFGLAALFGTCK